MNNIFLSIVVPVYNTEKYLEECLVSLIQKTEVNYEIICINDGSLDNSITILEEYSKKYNFIRVISQHNAGLSVARNMGIRSAQGEYIIFVDSDDMLYKDTISELCEELKREKPEILVYDADCIYETEYLRTTQYKDEYYHRKRSYGLGKKGQDMFCDMMEHNDFCDSACLMAINREWLLEKEIFFKSGMIYEDCLFSFLCYMQSENIVHTNKNYMIYRIREKSIMQSLPTFEHVDGRLETYCAVLKYLMEYECNWRLQRALGKFEEFICNNIKLTYAGLQQQEKEKCTCLKGAKLVLLKNICNISPLSHSETNIYVKGFEEVLKNSQSILIYGAGKVGRLMYEYLKKNGMKQKVKFFVVTEKDSNSKIDDIEITKITNIEDKKSLIILCARKDYQEEMYAEAKKNGFQNVVAIDYRLENYISSV